MKTNGRLIISARTILKEMYLEYVNDYLTVEKWAEHNGLTDSDGKCLLHFAERIFNSKHPEE